MFGRLQPLAENNDPGSIGFKNGYSVAELVLEFRILRDRTLEWGGSFWNAQLDFAAAYDSVDHSWLVESMVQRGLPRAEALWYVRETQASTSRPTHGPWAAGEIKPHRGLKQGCSCSPMLFRWCVQDVLLPLSA